jgi:hypothetical protein
MLQDYIVIEYCDCCPESFCSQHGQRFERIKRINLPEEVRELLATTTHMKIEEFQKFQVSMVYEPML